MYRTKCSKYFVAVIEDESADEVEYWRQKACDLSVSYLVWPAHQIEGERSHRCSCVGEPMSLCSLFRREVCVRQRRRRRAPWTVVGVCGFTSLLVPVRDRPACSHVVGVCLVCGIQFYESIRFGGASWGQAVLPSLPTAVGLLSSNTTLQWGPCPASTAGCPCKSLGVLKLSVVKEGT